MNLKIITATSEDAASIAGFVNSAYRGSSSRAGWTTEADLLGGSRTDEGLIRQTITKPNSVILLFHTGDELAASVNLERREDTCYLGMLTVKPEAQGQSIGRQVLTLAENYARENFASRRVEMTVISLREELIAWYERRGYRRTGKLIPFPNDPRFGILKVPSLALEYLEKHF